MSTPPLTETRILNPELGGKVAPLAQEFERAEPFPHVVVENFFAPEMAQRLLDDFPSFEDEFAKGEMGKGGRKAARRNVRDISDAYREVDDYIQTPEFLNLMSQISGIPDLMYDPEYHGGGTHENLDGASLYTHVDFNYHPRGWHRRLNLIVYLTPEWNPEWGGCLEVHSDPWDPANDEARELPAGFNQAVLFETSEHSWHGFRRIELPEDKRHLSRKSFAIYLYTLERPADQTAASHSTIYIPFGMPDDIKGNTTITPGQVNLLATRFAEYRNMLKLQYDRQLKQSEEFRDAYRMDLQGYAIQTRAPRGRFSDGWVSADFNLQFKPTRPASALRLELMAPKAMESGQTVHISVGGWSGTERLEPGEQQVVEIPLATGVGETLELAIQADATWVPGGADTRELAYRINSAALEH